MADRLTKQLRDSAKARADVVLAGDGVAVHSGRISKFRLSDLPAVNIVPSDLIVTGRSKQNPARVDAQVDVSIGILVASRDDALDIADAIAVKLETGLQVSKDWLPPVKDWQFESSDVSQQVCVDGECVALTLRFSAGLAYREDDPTAPLISAQPVMR